MRVSNDYPIELINALRTEEEVDATPGEVIARVVGNHARNLLRSRHRQLEKAKVKIEDPDAVTAKRVAEKVLLDKADAKADGDVELIIEAIK